MVRHLFAITTLASLALLSAPQAWSGDVTLEAPFVPLPAADQTAQHKDMPHPLVTQQGRNTHYSHERYARRLKDEQRLEQKGLESSIARQAVWAIAHKPQSRCAIYAMHLAGYHDMKFVRPDLTGRSEKATDQKLVTEIEDQKLCEKANLSKRLPRALPYVKADSVASLFKTSAKTAKSALIAAGLSAKNAEDAAWVVTHHPESSCAWQVERILADEQDGDHNSDDEKDAVFKIEHGNACSHAYYK